jgi:hypothetical protein
MAVAIQVTYIQIQVCPKRRKTGPVTQGQQQNTYASVVAVKTLQTDTLTEGPSNDLLTYNMEEPEQ